MDDEPVEGSPLFPLGAIQILLGKVRTHWNYILCYGIVFLFHASKTFSFCLYLSVCLVF